MIEGAAEENPLSTDLYAVLFKNSYSASLLVLGAVGALLLLNRVVPRAFCSLLCPVGAACDLANAALRRLPPEPGTKRAEHGC
ncbi:MAG: 4Fe-4S binding protein [Candidatus Dadabacteria bacterium]|nr:MAG: 4Fe-4S binding protein [Candidatus Dadabacteria bacterium]